MTESKVDTMFQTDLMCFSYLCSSNSDATQRLKYTNKILLPESVIYELKDNEDVTFPMFFKVTNKETKFGCVCGVEEFTAPPGVCHIPYQIMSEISVTEGETVNIELIDVPKGDFVKLRFHKSDFSKLSDPKIIMEKIMSSDYPVITKGQTIVLNYKELNKIYHVDIIDTKPTEVIKIIDTNLNVDFDKSLDYVETPPPPCVAYGGLKTPPVEFASNYKVVKDISANLNAFKKTKGFVPFSGTGYRLGSQ